MNISKLRDVYRVGEFGPDILESFTKVRAFFAKQEDVT
jgi:hypothetical protein